MGIRHTETCFPVTIVMERTRKFRGQWSFIEWKATGIVPDESDAVSRAVAFELVHQDQQFERYLWRGFTIELLKDCAESYWNNLMASNPALFIVCRDNDDDGNLTPFMVTADYDEIIGYMEVDDQVFSLPIPPSIYAWLEHYVVNNYVPPERRKRKRTKWDDNDGKTPPIIKRH